MEPLESQEAFEQERRHQEAYVEWWQRELAARLEEDRRALKPGEPQALEEWLTIFLLGFGMVYLAGLIQIAACAAITHLDLSAINIAWSLSIGFIAYITLLVRLTK
jgi:hypothetical protein